MAGKSGIGVFLVQLPTEKKRFNMNNFLNHITSQYTAQAQPERTIIFQHTKPKYKAGKRRTCFSTATTAKCIHQSNQEKLTKLNPIN